ncbi:hypothetical protein [Qipengyuania qiaonensis]|uniref:Uncharacterized protein n=1 Tax=Qipengyuania qiaonensis TaxID=2867240 RepID=A0ABS7J7E8_9SPHN|nr:hypothetical protein [Qipengyuania qiaonensis]MBX7483186.1 hypothetical protein [Qipengyuania qiaonensis]
MTRFFIQVALTLAVLAFAWSRGGRPERYVATIYFLLVSSGIARWLATGQWSQEGYGELQIFRFVADIVALVAVTAVALSFDRWWTLWVSSAQFIAVVSHLLRAANLPLEPIVYAIMERWPVWLALIITGLGTLAHYRRMKSTVTT